MLSKKYALILLIATGLGLLGPTGEARLRPAYSGQCGKALAMLDGLDTPARTFAERLGLHYIELPTSGIHRRSLRGQTSYIDSKGHVIRDLEALRRIAKLGIPPGYHDVWISEDPNSHIQATGIDKRGRVQYLYHPRWIEGRKKEKFTRLENFADTLPDLRRSVERDLSRSGLPREKILAAVVRLLDRSLIRVGNETYAKQNGSFGLTTLRGEHVQVAGDRITFQFVGKSHVLHTITVEDAQVAAILSQLHPRAMDPVFQFSDDRGTRHPVTSDEVNEYLHRNGRENLSAKDFRTWSGTVIAAGELHRLGPSGGKQEERKKLKAALAEVAKRLGNTPAVSRASYVDRRVLEAYRDGSLEEAFRRARRRRSRRQGDPSLSVEEEAVAIVLQEKPLSSMSPL